jgi:hypothetical protein
LVAELALGSAAAFGGCKRSPLAIDGGRLPEAGASGSGGAAGEGTHDAAGGTVDAPPDRSDGPGPDITGHDTCASSRRHGSMHRPARRGRRAGGSGTSAAQRKDGLARIAVGRRGNFAKHLAAQVRGAS